MRQELLNRLMFLHQTIQVVSNSYNKSTPILFLSLCLSLTVCSKNSSSKNSSKDIFSFNLPVEMKNTDPQLTRGTASNYFLFNLHRGLTYYNGDDQLKFWGAKVCKWETELKLKCIIAERKFSDGSIITSYHYLNSIKTLFKSKKRQIEYLKNLKGFKEQLADSNSDFISIKTPDRETLVFNFLSKDPAFIHKLSHQVFTPRKKAKLYNNPKEMFYSGPYKFLNLTKSRIKMINNKYFNDLKRPNVEAVFIDESQAALNLYESNQISFLRFLPTHELNHFKDSKLVFKSFLARLDGIILSPHMLKDINLRKALTHSLDFNVLKKIYSSESDPGCPPLPDTYFLNDTPPCFKLDLKKANLHFNKVLKPVSKLTIYVPKIESNDHVKMAEWAQESWKKNLGINVNIEQFEAGVLREKVKKTNIALYRKGFNLEQLGCYSALENFLSFSPTNFINFKSKDFDNSFLRESPISLNTLKCSSYFKNILDEYLWIPTGMLYFAHLHSKFFKGYTINSLNQFDLSNLRKREMRL